MKFTSIFLFLSILVLGLANVPASADVVPIQNASFEVTTPPTGSCVCGPFNLGPIPDWMISGGVAGSWQPTAVSFSSVPDGITVAYSNGGTISQTLTTSLAAATTYTLSVDIGHRLDVSTSPNGYVADYMIALYVGNTLLKSFGGSTGSITPGTFADETVTFTSGAAVTPGNLRIVLTSAGSQTDFDNVRLIASAVPEPASLSLLAGGLALVLFVFRRR